MKALLKAVLVSCALAAPAIAFAQTTNGPVTRAEVRADLARLEQAGYQPEASDPHYPADIQAAEAKVTAQDQSAAAASVGGVSLSGSSQSGSPVTLDGGKSIYFGH
jgi:hypothetical protein